MPKKDTTAEDTTSETVNEAEASETEKKDEKTSVGLRPKVFRSLRRANKGFAFGNYKLFQKLEQNF